MFTQIDDFEMQISGGRGGMSIYGTLAVSNPLYLWIIIFKSRILLHSLQRELVLSKFFCMMWVYFLAFIIVIILYLSMRFFMNESCPLLAVNSVRADTTSALSAPAQHLADMLHIYQNIKFPPKQPRLHPRLV